MSEAEFLSQLARLCNTSAEQALQAQLSLGAKPDQPPAATLNWEMTKTRLTGQIQSLTDLAPKLAAASIIVGLHELGDDLGRLREITARAEQEIREINAVSDLLTKIGRVLDVGLAVVGLAAAPSVATAQGVVRAVEALVS